MATLRLADLLLQASMSPCGVRTRVVAVDGPSGSGKTTLAQRLAHRAGAPLLSGDDFLSWPDMTTWWPRFEEQVLASLARGEGATYQARDWELDEFGTSLGAWKTLPWAPLVVVEGTTFSRREAGAALAFRVWVEAPEAVRLARGLARDGESHRELWMYWMKREQEFFAADRTRQAADILVDGAPVEPHDPENEVVLLDR